eukprot:CAMPEP_0114574726 /NCGR_PEP_ID=MMETSP0114-20121206/19555_1 /TAXON_ID=31324 /ORGANISM="Goniomonas sp, Strain m" /LENGTH=144 /DNA_ID=CAMNT_0001762175 /DNA_START=231 /DNA_END=662 /DNA_ORIENTATION=-
MVAWHPTKEILVSASYDDTLRVWASDDDEWSSASILVGHKSTVWAVCFDATGEHMASCSDDLSVIIWRDEAPGKTVPSYVRAATLTGHHSRPIYHIDWCHSSGLLVTGAGDDSIRVYEQGEGGWTVAAAKDMAHAGDVNCVKFQ